MTRDRFPIQGGLTVSWEAAEQAYKGYVSRFGANQTLERLAERGGFGVLEFIRLFSHDRPWARRDQSPTDVEMATALAKGDIRQAKTVDAAFYEWVREDVNGVQAGASWLCPGARIVVDKEGNGTITADESLPDGVWLVTDADGNTRRLEGVTPTKTSSIPMDMAAVRAAVGAPPSDADLWKAVKHAEDVARSFKAGRGIDQGAEDAQDLDALVAFLGELRSRRWEAKANDVRVYGGQPTPETIVRLGRVIRTLAFTIMRVAEDGASMTSHAVRQDKVVQAVKEWTSSSHIDWLYPPDHLSSTLQGEDR